MPLLFLGAKRTKPVSVVAAPEKAICVDHSEEGMLMAVYVDDTASNIPITSTEKGAKMARPFLPTTPPRNLALAVVGDDEMQAGRCGCRSNTPTAA